MTVLLLVSTPSVRSREPLLGGCAALWSQVVRIRPAYWSGHYNLGLSLLGRKPLPGSSAGAGKGRSTQLRRALCLCGARPCGGWSGRSSRCRRRISACARAQSQSTRVAQQHSAYCMSGSATTPAPSDSLRRALAIDAAAAGTRSNLAVCYLQQGKFADAVREFEQLAKATPNDASHLLSAWHRLRRDGSARRRGPCAHAGGNSCRRRRSCTRRLRRCSRGSLGGDKIDRAFVLWPFRGAHTMQRCGGVWRME